MFRVCEVGLEQQCGYMTFHNMCDGGNIDIDKQRGGNIHESVMFMRRRNPLIVDNVCSSLPSVHEHS